MLLAAEVLRQMRHEAEQADEIEETLNYLIRFADTLGVNDGATHPDGLRALPPAVATQLYAQGVCAHIAFDADASWRNKFGLHDEVFARDNVFACVACFALNGIIERVSRLAHKTRVSNVFAENIVKNTPRLGAWANAELRRHGSLYALRRGSHHYFTVCRA